MKYDYLCDCGAREERDYPMRKAHHYLACACGGRKVRIITSFGFQLKGEGWAGKSRF